MPSRNALQELRVPSLERAEDRAPAAPACVGEETRPQAEQLAPRHSGHRSRVEHVLPREHRAAERRLPQGVAGALPVRDMHELRWHHGLLSAACEVRRAAGAVVERVARTADDARELLPHASKPGDPAVDLVDLRRHAHPQGLRRRSRSPHRLEDVRDLAQREAERLSLLDRPQETDRLLVVAAVAAGLTIRLRQESAALVVTERLDVDACAGSGLSNPHGTSMHPYLGTDVKGDVRAAREASRGRRAGCSPSRPESGGTSRRGRAGRGGRTARRCAAASGRRRPRGRCSRR